MKVTTFLLALFFIISCGNSKPASSTQATNVAIGLGSSFEYELSGVDDKNEACTTGRKTFINLHDLCLDLQKPTDYECALLEKKSEFARACEPAGYKYREAVSCEVRLVEQATHTNNSADKIAANKKICVGPKVGSLTKETEQTARGKLNDLVVFSIGLSVSDKGETTGLVAVVDSTSGKAVETKLDYKGLDTQKAIQSGDGRFMIEQTCQRVYACE